MKGSSKEKKEPDVPVTTRTKDFLCKKLELISGVANIFHSLGLPPIDFYTMYLKHIEFVFGP